LIIFERNLCIDRHNISISGLHITMIAGLFAGLFFALWHRSSFIGATLPTILLAQKATAVAGAATASVYVLLVGFGVPTQRPKYTALDTT
jgi:competence protein ComEC